MRDRKCDAAAVIVRDTSVAAGFNTGAAADTAA
jgi:hypothetical protein